jgi:hypothetical protein
MMKFSTKRRLYLVGVVLWEVGGGFIFGVCLALAAFVQVMDIASRSF